MSARCSRIAYPVIKGLQRELGDQLRFVYRNFPLREIHHHAQHAAEAAETAASQDRFWEMLDYLFEHQRALDDEHLHQYAAPLGLETEIFDQRNTATRGRSNVTSARALRAASQGPRPSSSTEFAMKAATTLSPC